MAAYSYNRPVSSLKARLTVLSRVYELDCRNAALIWLLLRKKPDSMRFADR